MPGWVGGRCAGREHVASRRVHDVRQRGDVERVMRRVQVGIVAQQLIGYIDLVRMVPATRQVRDYVAGSGTASFCRAQHLPLRPFSEATRPPVKFF